MDHNVYEACSDLITTPAGVHSGKKRHRAPSSADEVLSQKVGGSIPIPFLTRDDLEDAAEEDRQAGVFQGSLLPKIDLRVLHYHATQLILQRYPHLINKFDETSLITLGLLIEKWIDDFFISKGATETTKPSKDTVPGFYKGPGQTVAKAIDYENAPGDI